MTSTIPQGVELVEHTCRGLAGSGVSPKVDGNVEEIAHGAKAEVVEVLTPLSHGRYLTGASDAANRGVP
jgi:hypothetical protein